MPPQGVRCVFDPELLGIEHHRFHSGSNAWVYIVDQRGLLQRLGHRPHAQCFKGRAKVKQHSAAHIGQVANVVFQGFARVTLLVGTDSEHRVLERQQTTQAQAQYGKRDSGDGSDQFDARPKNPRDHLRAIDRGGNYIVYFALQHHVVKIIARVAHGGVRGYPVIARRAWGRTVNRFGQAIAGSLQKRSDPYLRWDRHPTLQVVRHTVDLFQPVVE